MNIFEILAGTTPTGTPGFLYRTHDGITQHEYAWVEETNKQKILREIEANLRDYFSVEFPVKCGYTVPFWNNKNGSAQIIEFESVSKEDQLYFTEPIKKKRG